MTNIAASLYNQSLPSNDSIIQAIEKQRPMKIRFDKRDGKVYCPACGECKGYKRKYTDSPWLKRRYCDLCGQALDWSEV